MEKKMKEKKFENSILIEGNYSFNYLTNLLFLSKRCLTDIFVKKSINSKTNKKMFKNIKHLCEFLESSIDVFSKISRQDNEDKIIIHTIEYVKDKPAPVPSFEDIDLSQATAVSVEDIRNSFKDNKITTGLQLVNELSDDVIKKNKEVDNKYNEEN